jgi:N-acetylmuramoyl-L-alanine amidase
MEEHVVRQGECLTTIAQSYGFANPEDIYRHSANADLRKIRPDMNVLFPGDVVVIPDRQRKQVACATCKSHKFTVNIPTKKLVIKLVDAESKPMDGLPYELAVGDKTFKGTTDGGGTIEHDIDVAAVRAMLSLCGGRATEVRIGALNPTKDTDDEGTTGIQARLHNLGYDPGPVDGVAGPRTMGALIQFQTDNNLQPTGEVDDATLAALQRAHGV